MRRISVLAGCVSLILLAGCTVSSQHTASLSSMLAAIDVSGPNNTLPYGQSQQMQAMGIFGDGSSHDVTNSVSWSSSNSAVAAVNSAGMVTATGNGQCVIRAQSQNLTGTFSLAVSPTLVSIAVTPANSTIAPGTTLQLFATGTYSDKSTQNLTSSVVWASGNPAVATVSSAAPTMGLARAVSSGSTTITASSGNIQGVTALSVSSAAVSSLTISPTSLTLPLGLSQQFTAIAKFSDGTQQDVTGVAQWQSSATSVVTITKSGLATAIDIGTATVSGTFGGVTATSLLTINAANLISISIQPSDPTMAAGTGQQLVAKGTFNDGSTRDVTFLATWSSSTPAVASIGSGNAIVSALTPGLTNITATLGGVVGTTSLTVTNATITSVLVSPANATIPTGALQSFTATGVFSDSSTQDITSCVSWSSSNTAVATIVASTSQAMGVAAGTANISATFSFAGKSQSGSSSLTVSSATLASLSLTPATAEIAPGSSQEYLAVGTFSNGSTQDMNTLVAWSSSDPNVATVTHPGVVTGESAGVVTITAKQGSISANATLLVESATLTSIQVTPQNSSVPVGFQTALKALGTFSNGDTQDLTEFVNWTSSNPSAATISNAQPNPGRATGVQPGSTTISAIFSGQVGTASLSVTNASLVSIAVTPSSASVTVGKSQQFAATGSFTDGSSLSLSDQVAWSSSTPGVATIDTLGLANALSSGTTTISAQLKGVTGAATLNVQ